MKKYLLDTNFVSEPMKTVPDLQVMKMIERYQHEIVTASPVWHELRFGCLRLPPSRKRKMIETYLEQVLWRNLEILPYDTQAAGWHAEERARLTAEGQTPSFVAGQIAAIAKVNGLILVTRNAVDFSIFKALVVQNWFKGDG